MYVITALREGEHVRTSRLEEASAIVLSRRLAERGFSDVVVTDRNGIRRSSAEFQRWALIQMKTKGRRPT